MARQNVEDEWWSDPRRIRLALAMGCQFKADGVAMAAWKLAERFWVPERALIPLATWEDAGMPQAFLDSKLAEIREEGIYVRGTEERNAWRFKAAERGRLGGNKSAAVRKERNGTAQPRPKHNRSSVEAGSKPSEPSSSFSSSFKENTNTPPYPPQAGGVVNGLNQISLCIDAWSETLQFFKIERDAKLDAVAIGRLIQRYGPDDTLSALRGARVESGTETFRPSEHLSLRRIARPDVFAKLVLLGSRRAGTPSARLKGLEDLIAESNSAEGFDAPDAG